MMKPIRTLALAALAAASLGTAAVSLAQWGPGAGYGPGTGVGPCTGYGPGARNPGFLGNSAGPAANVEARLTTLRTQLDITGAQEPAWNAFAAAATQRAQEMQAFRDQVTQAPTTAPERHALMQQRAAGMAAMGDALNGLYAVLTAQQRAIFDRQHLGGGRRG